MSTARSNSPKPCSRWSTTSWISAGSTPDGWSWPRSTVDLASFLERLRLQLEPRAASASSTFRCELAAGHAGHGPGRSRPPAPDPAQPARQRAQVHLGGPCRAARRPRPGRARGPGRPGSSRSRTPAPASRRGAAAAVLRLRAGRPGHAAPVRRQRPRADDRAAADPGHGRAISRCQPRRPGHHLSRRAGARARRPGTAGRGLDRRRQPPGRRPGRARRRRRMAEIAAGWGLVGPDRPHRPPGAGAAGRGRRPRRALRHGAGRPQPRRARPPEQIAAAIRAEPRLRHARSGPPGGFGHARRRGAAPGGAGFAAYLRKPVAAETLLDCLRTLRAGQHGGDGGPDHRPQHLGAASRRRCGCCSPTTTRSTAAWPRSSCERGGHKVDAVPDGLRRGRGAAAAALRRSCCWTCRCRSWAGWRPLARIRALPDPRPAPRPRSSP